MARSKSLSMAVAGVFLVAGAGCGADDERLPAPRPADYSGLGGGAQGGGGGGGAVTPNVCECAYSAIISEVCGECVNDAAFEDCAPLGQDCEADDSCPDISGCPAKCYGLAADAKPACVQACVLENQDKSGFPLYTEMMGCVCEVCADLCAPKSPLACE